MRQLQAHSVAFSGQKHLMVLQLVPHGRRVGTLYSRTASGFLFTCCTSGLSGAPNRKDSRPRANFGGYGRYQDLESLANGGLHWRENHLTFGLMNLL